MPWKTEFWFFDQGITKQNSFKGKDLVLGIARVR